jgi:hypothetical protein
LRDISSNPVPSRQKAPIGFWLALASPSRSRWFPWTLSRSRFTLKRDGNGAGDIFSPIIHAAVPWRRSHSDTGGVCSDTNSAFSTQVGQRFQLARNKLAPAVGNPQLITRVLTNETCNNAAPVQGGHCASGRAQVEPEAARLLKLACCPTRIGRSVRKRTVKSHNRTVKPSAGT